MNTSPLVGFKNPANKFNNVVFPDPLSPFIAINSPSSIFKFTLLMISPELNLESYNLHKLFVLKISICIKPPFSYLEFIIFFFPVYNFKITLSQLLIAF